MKASCSDSFQICLSFEIPVCGTIIWMMVVPLSAPFVNFKWSSKKLLQCALLISNEFVYRHISVW